jgi:hypothetical protein
MMMDPHLVTHFVVVVVRKCGRDATHSCRDGNQRQQNLLHPESSEIKKTEKGQPS